ncbi:MAG TPA: hypothetical protein VGC10_02285 [Sphingomonas sp.]
MSGPPYLPATPHAPAGLNQQRCGYASFWMRIMIWATRHCARS